jgi:hypothetical protein
MEHLMTPARKENILKVLAEVDRVKKGKRDYLYPANKLGMTDAGGLAFAATDTFAVGDTIYTEWADAEKALDGLRAAGDDDAAIRPLGKEGSLPLSRVAEGQLAERLGIPIKYVDALRCKENADLAAHNFRVLLGRSAQRFLVRTLDGKVRAVLSNAYRVLDNADVFLAAAETLQKADAQIWHARLSDDSFELFAVSKTIAGEVASSGSYQSQSYGWWNQGGGAKQGAEGFALNDRPVGDKDVHYAAVRISNSETGRGGLHVTPTVLRAVCNNSVVIGKTVSSIHLGRRKEEEGLVYAADTVQSESQTAWLKLRDTIKTCFDAGRFAAYVDCLNGLTKEGLGEQPQLVVERVANQLEIPEERRAAILQALFQSNDLTRFGLVQAVTFQAHAADEAGRPEEASALEEAGGKLVEMPAEAFGRLLLA